MRNAHLERPASSMGAAISSATVKWATACAAGSPVGALAIGIRSRAPRTRTHYKSAMSVLADYERSRGSRRQVRYWGRY